MTDPTGGLRPRTPVTVQLGHKRYTLRYTMLSKALMEERHGSIEDYWDDVASRKKVKGSMTTLLAGLEHEGLTERQLSDLIGEDHDEFVETAHLAFREAVRALKWDGIFTFMEDAAPGEAPAAPAAETSDSAGDPRTGPTPSTSPSQT